MAESSVVQPSDAPDTQAAQSEADTQAAPTSGTDGNAPSPSGGEAAVQTGAEGSPAEGAAQQQARSAAAQQPGPPALTEAEWRQKSQAEKAEQDRLDSIAAAKADLSEFRTKAPIRARDYFDKLYSTAGIFVPPEERKDFLDLIEEFGLKGERSAKLELGEEIARLNGITAEVANSMYDELGDEANDFSRAVSNKLPAGWVKEFATRQQATGRADALVAFVEAGASALEGEAKTGFVEAVSKAESMEDLAKALREATLREAETMPRGAPRGIAGAPAGGGRFRDLNALNAAKLAGQLSDQEYLAEQNKLLGVA